MEIKHHKMGKVSVLIVVTIYFAIGVPLRSNLVDARTTQSSKVFDSNFEHEFSFLGPRQEILPKYASNTGFWSFAIVTPNVISRSGQPSMIDFRWLKDNGWKGVVNLRTFSDIQWPGLKGLNFNYLALPIKDNSVPTDKQVQDFLEFVSSSYNQPVHVYCHAGIGRTGLMIALYRYMIEGWSINRAISESRLFDGGINKVQENWLKTWAQGHTDRKFHSNKETIKGK